MSWACLIVSIVALSGRTVQPATVTAVCVVADGWRLSGFFMPFHVVKGSSRCEVQRETGARVSATGVALGGSGLCRPGRGVVVLPGAACLDVQDKVVVSEVNHGG